MVFTKETSGGTGTFLQQFKELRTYCNMFFCFYKQSSLNSSFSHKIVYTGNYPSDSKFSLKKLYIFIHNIIQSALIIKKYQGTVIFTCDIYSLITVACVRRLFPRKRFIASYHVNIEQYVLDKPQKFYRSILRSILRICMQQFDLHVSVSQGLGEALIKNFYIPPKKVTVIYNGIPHSQQNTDPKTGEKGIIRIYSVGRIDKQKDYQNLIEALSLVIKKRRDVELFILGEGEEKRIVEQLVKKYNLEDYVTFCGRVPDVYSYLQKGDIFVSASKYEGFGYAILEAMSAGVPVIVTDAPYGPRELIGERNAGILVPPSNAFALAKAIDYLCENPALRFDYAQKGRKRAADFSSEHMIQQYRTIFNI